MGLHESDLSIKDANANARRMAAERAAAAPFTTEALEAGIVSDALVALAACISAHDRTSRDGTCDCVACINGRRVLRVANWGAR